MAKLSNENSLKTFFLLKFPDLVYKPTKAAVAGKKSLLDGAVDFLSKSDTTLQHLVLCQLYFLCYSGSLHTTINLFKWGLNINEFISNISVGAFL